MDTDERARRRPRPPTVNDVARWAAVSRQTVSNVVNRPERVRPDTRERVRAAMTALGYQPNRMARSLQSNRSCMLGFELPRSDGPLPNQLMGAFLERLAVSAHHRGYQLLLVRRTDDAVAEFAELHGARLLDGVVLAEVERDDPRPARLRAHGIPSVAFGEVDGTAWVDIDGRAGMAAAVRHLLARGHRRIAMLAWPAGSQAGDARVGGVLAELAAHDLAPTAVARVRNTLEAGRAALPGLLASGPTAVVAVSDLLAAGLLQAAARRRLRVPEDLAVVGYDDSPLAAVMSPSLTTVAQPLAEVAQALVERVTACLSGRAPDSPLLLTPSLVVREST